MSTATTASATVRDLCRTEGKAELIGGRIVTQMPAGRRHSGVAYRIVKQLDHYIEQIRVGEVHPDGLGYVVPELPSGRESFCPDASYVVGPFTEFDTGFIAGPPAFAVEVRGDDDYGPVAEAEMAAKRDDYFLAGTAVVWDVDPKAQAIHVYRRGNPTQPDTFTQGQIADAEPAVPGWRVDVDTIFTV